MSSRRIIPMTNEEVEEWLDKYEEDLEEISEDYPDRCAVCDEELEDPHPDDPPVCGPDCEGVFFGDRG